MPYKDPEKKRQHDGLYYQAHKEEIKARSRRYYLEHREEILAQDRLDYQEDPEKKKSYSRRYRAEHPHKIECFRHYGDDPPKCACCGEAHVEFLSIDHIGGGGAEHRKEVGRGNTFYAWLVKNKFPPGFRVLCINCNFSIGKFGYCPHKKRG